MASKRLKTVFILRFLSYFFIFTGFSALIFEFGPVAMAEYGYRKDQLFRVERSVAPLVVTSSGVQQNGGASFGKIGASENIIQPVDTEYGLVIEKINANAKVVANVDPANEREYMAALQQGVAEAAGSTKPGENGNLYLFSHSTDAPWNVIRYNAIFFLLRELERGDRIIVYYQGRRYDYLVFDKQVVPPTSVEFLTNTYDKPVLTLQACDPPGTLINRLIVRAQLVNS